MKKLSKVIETMIVTDPTRPWTVPATGGPGATSTWGWGGGFTGDAASTWGWGGGFTGQDG